MDQTKPRFNIKDNVAYDEQPQDNQSPVYVTEDGQIQLTHPDHQTIFKPKDAVPMDLGINYSESPP